MFIPLLADAQVGLDLPHVLIEAILVRVDAGRVWPDQLSVNRLEPPDSIVLITLNCVGRRLSGIRSMDLQGHRQNLLNQELRA